MALNQVLQQGPKQSGGKGGLFGKIAGTIIGGGAGFLAGGPVGAAMGASAGAGLGGTLGDIVDPAKVSDGGGGIALNAVQNRPQVQLAELMDSQKALMSASDFSMPEKEELNQTVFAPTITKLKQQIGMG